jgi:3-hydroxybutyryl-CoA dehydrogenase
MMMSIERVSVVGTGILGTQIALLAAYAGNEVKAYDPVDGAFEVTCGILYQDLKAKITKPFIPWSRWPGCKSIVRKAATLEEAVSEADLIIEAVLENLDLKRKVFKEICRSAQPGSIVATASSSLPVSSMASAGGRPEYCLNLHFYFPLQGVNLVDIMGDPQTLPSVLEKGAQWIRSLGCLPLYVNKGMIGFGFSSVWRAVKRQTLYLWGENNIDFRDIDRAWMIFTGMREGPFALMDEMGLDLIYDIEMVYYRESRNPKDKPPDMLREKIKKGELGVKSGKGFYTYPKPEFLCPDFLNPP